MQVISFLDTENCRHSRMSYIVVSTSAPILQIALPIEESLAVGSRRGAKEQEQGQDAFKCHLVRVVDLLQAGKDGIKVQLGLARCASPWDPARTVLCPLPRWQYPLFR